MMTLRFSRGRVLEDNYPRQHEVADFAAFVAVLDADRTPAGDTAYVCAPLNGNGHRCKEGVEPRGWLAVDLDKIEADIFADLRLWFARFSGCAWPTRKSTPDAPRERIIIELDRDVTHAEGLRLGAALTLDIGVEFGDAVDVDPSTFRGEQAAYLPKRDVCVARFHGSPLAVDAFLEAAPPVPARPVQATTGNALVNIKAGQALHETIGRLIAQWAGKGMPRSAIHAAAMGLLEHARAARGSERVDEFAGDELGRLIDGALRKFSPPRAIDEPEEPVERVLSRRLDFHALAGLKAPLRTWRRFGWLGAGATLLAGSGGQGKSTLIQHEATCGALGLAYFAPACDPYRSLVWNAEDEHDDLWRRQEQICQHEGLDMAALAGVGLYIESRFGCENALMAPLFKVLGPTLVLRELREQVNDLRIEQLWLDNAAHFFAGNHDDRSEVTMFINALNGLVVGRPFGVVVTAHVSRAQGSEFSGSVAWENAPRMRWFFGNKLPDQNNKPGDDDDPAPTVRFLSKRKHNHSASDHVRLNMVDGLLIPDQHVQASVGGIVASLDAKRAEGVCIAGFNTLCERGIRTTDGKTSPDFLPRQLAEKGLACGYTRSELGSALNRLIGVGTFVRGVVGKQANRSDNRFGLVLTDDGEIK